MDARELKMKSIPSNPEIARTYTRLWMWGSWTTPRTITEPAVCEGVNVLPLLKKKSDRERERETGAVQLQQQRNHQTPLSLNTTATTQEIPPPS